LLNQSLDAPAPYRFSLWVGTVLGLAALVPLAQIGPIERLAGATLEPTGGPFPRLQMALVIGFVYLSHGAWATCQAFCNAYLDTDLRLPTASIGLIMGAGQFLAILAPMLIPRLATRRSNGWTLMMTALGTSLCLLPLALLPHWIAASLGSVGIIALAAVWMPAFQVYQMELVAAQWRSLAYGIVSAAMGFTFASISLGGGYLAATWGYRSLFLLGVGMSLFGAALMWFMLKKPIVSAPSAEFR
jgi:predicted MFS family arabinose efflux permease